MIPSPSPRLRDQLTRLFYRQGDDGKTAAWRAQTVEEVVATAANQRAEEAVKALRGLADEWRRQGAVRDFGLSLTEAGNRIDTELNVALASPAPAPHPARRCPKGCACMCHESVHVHDGPCPGKHGDLRGDPL